ncbi:MAG: PLP-dependent aminotransferase family protein [Oscillospiraceae bacterium]|nr:PLP-dependent aminotransferase family protein [Oscillospiraceae bacterium]
MQIELSNRMNNIDPKPLKDMFVYGIDPDIISFACGNPDSALFPNAQLSEIAARVLLEMPVQSLQYGTTNGYAPFINTVIKRLNEVEKITCAPNELLITSGAQQGMELIAKILINEGDTVIVDEPTFIGAMNAFRSYGAKLIGIPLRDDGMDLDILEQKLRENPKTKLIYSIPTASNPMGSTMSEEKRKEFYSIIKKYRVFVLEDNPYGELYFDGIHRPTLKSFDTENLILYCGSFSKILSPGLRIGYVCAQKEIIDALATAKQTADLQTAVLPQLMANEYLKTYDINAHIEKLRNCYKEKCYLMLDCIKTYFPETIYYTKPVGGLFLWCDLMSDIDTNQLINKCVEQKIAYVPGYAFMTDINKPYSTLRLNYSAVSKEKIPEGLEKLGKILKNELRN